MSSHDYAGKVMDKAYQRALIVIILLACLANVVWIYIDATPSRYMDDAVYLTQSVDLYYTLTTDGLSAFLLECLKPAREHPPMIKILPIPLYIIFKPSTDAALYALTLLIPIFLVYLFLLTRTLLNNEKIALLAMVITACFPLTFGLWRSMMIEFGMAVATVASLYHLIQSDGLRVRTHVIGLGLFLAWGMLWKGLFPLFVSAPIIYILVRRVRALKPGEVGPLIRHLVLLCGVVLLVAGPFYVRGGRRIMSFAWANIMDPATTEPWGLGPVFSLRTLIRYWIYIINGGISFYFFLLLVTCGLAYLVRPKKSFPPFALAFLMAWSLVPFVVGSLSQMKELRYMFPIYPVPAILLAVWLNSALAAMKSNRQIVVFGLLAVFPVYQFLLYSYKLSFVPKTDIRWGPFLLSVKDPESLALQVISQYNMPADPVKWPVDEVVKIIKSNAQEGRHRATGVLVPALHPRINFTTLAHQAALDRTNMSFREGLTDAEFVVLLTGPGGQYGMWDTRDTRLQKILDDQRLPFVLVGRVPLPERTEALIYRKVADIMPADYRPWDDLRVLQDYDAITFDGHWTELGDGSRAQPVISQEPGTATTLSYIYVPKTGAALQFAVGMDESKVVHECAQNFQIKAAAMTRYIVGRPAPDEYLLCSGTIRAMSKPSDRRGYSGEVDLGEFAGKIIEIILTSDCESLSGGPCNRLAWNRLKLIYYTAGHN